MAQKAKERLWITYEHQARHAVHFVAGSGKRNGAFVIALEGESIAVVGIAVGFDDHPLLLPEEVDEIGTDHYVDMRLRQPLFATEREEVNLRRRLGLDGLRTDLVSYPTQPT